MRGFIAIEAGSEVSARLAGLAGELRKTSVRASYPKVFHITLKFLGEFDESRLLEKIKVAMAAACVGVEKFSLKVMGMGCFPSSSRPRVIFAAVAGDGRLEALAGRVEEEMAKLGFGRENRKFEGHITLARLKGPARLGDFLEKYRNAYFGSIAVERVALKKSVLAPAGPVYEDVHSVEL